MRAAVAAYNAGPGKVDPETAEINVANKDYSNDVWARAQHFHSYKPEKLKKGQLSHTVGKSETLSKIAAKYGTTVEELKSLNPQVYDANMVFPGENLVVPKGKE